MRRTTLPGYRAIATAAAALAAATALAAAPVGAQESREGAEVRVHGLLDVVAAPGNEAAQLNVLNAGGSVFDPYRVRLFVEGSPSSKLDVFGQFLMSDITGFGVYGAYAQYTPDPGRDLHLQAGKIPWPVGTFGPRTYSDRNPLVGTPLLYQYHTTLRADQPAPDVDAVLARAGRGQYGVSYVTGASPMRGLPIVYDACWDVGATVVGSQRPFEYALGVVYGTPAAPRFGRENNADKSVLGRLGVAPLAGVRAGVSGSIGGYVPVSAEPALPVGARAEDYDQRVAMVDLEWMFGRVELRAEGVVSTWETPYAGDLTMRGGYAEGKYAFPVGLFLAARWDALAFSSVQGTSGPARPWDDEVRRFEGGVGFRVERRLALKLVYQSTTLDAGAGAAGERRFDLLAGQASIGF